MFCAQCGTEAAANSRFCVSCGAPLGQEQSVAPSTSRPLTVRTSRRPTWVWVISGFYLFSVGWTLLSFALIFSGAISINAAQQQYFASLGTLDYLSSVGIGVVTIWAAVLLFRLRKGAGPAFGLAVVLNIGLTLIQVLTKN